MTKDPVVQLASLLRDAGMVPRLRPKHIVRSTRYDPFYRACTVLIAIEICGSRIDESASINHQLLRLVEFVAVHPGLFTPLEAWVNARRSGYLVPLQHWATFPAGYATDLVHDSVVTYLVATGEVKRNGTKVMRTATISGRSQLNKTVKTALEGSVFVGEVKTLERLKQLPLTMRLLEI